MTSRAPLTPQPCACGCGQLAAVDERRNRVSRYVNGHNARERTGSANPRHKHGMEGTPTYRSWRSMMNRCTNPNAHNFQNWGGRGITVCARWRGSDGFTNFLADMGERPPHLTLDRIDNDGNYEPGNCRWASAAQQARTRRKPM